MLVKYIKIYLEMLESMVTTPLLSSDAACDCHSKQTNTEQSTLRLEND